jgi:hypothetical protein
MTETTTPQHEALILHFKIGKMGKKSQKMNFGPADVKKINYFLKKLEDGGLDPYLEEALRCVCLSLTRNDLHGQTLSIFEAQILSNLRKHSAKLSLPI